MALTLLLVDPPPLLLRSKFFVSQSQFHSILVTGTLKVRVAGPLTMSEYVELPASGCKGANPSRGIGTHVGYESDSLSV